jgi:DNA-binding NtrC family response regulator/polyferredoxin
MGASADLLDDLKQTHLFSGLPLDGLDEVAERVRRRTFAAGEVIVHRGDPGATMLLILRGTAAVTLTNAEGAEYTIATLGPGEVFGEMALLTGEPRSANVKALSELSVIEIHQDEFQEMVRAQPELNRRLLRLLAQRLGKTTVQQEEEHWESREVIANLLSFQEPPPFDHFPGKTKWAGEINDAIARVADAGNHALVLGEPGTGKELVAKLIHYRDGGQHKPLFSMDCANPPPVLREMPRAERGAPLDSLTEFAQEAALFGHQAGSTAFATGTRKGYLELADGGTLVLAGVAYLGPRVQALLLNYLQTGTFSRMGETTARRSAVRIVACSSQDAEDAGAAGELDPELEARLSGEIIRLKPLRKRKPDIPVLAELYLTHYARKAHRDIKGFSRDALRALVDHEWPFNINGLRHVVERAVAVCPSDRITDEHILLDIAPFEAKGAFNLLRVDWVRKLVDRRAFPAVVQYASVPIFLLLMLYALFGPQTNNLANLVIWTIGWPLLLVATLISARSWCACCPLPPLSHAIGRLTKQVAQVPRWLRLYGVWIGMGGVVLIMWSEHAFHMPADPRATGVLLLSILAAAVVTALLMGERIWCRHLCPLGQLVSQCATFSPAQLRSNSNVCLTECQTHDCVKDGNCPMNVHPSTTAAAHDCILCFACVRSCTHDAVRLEMRAPWRKILEQKKWELPRAAFPVVLIATVLALGLSSWLTVGNPGAHPAGATVYPGLTGPAILGFLLVTLGYTALVALASGKLGWQSLTGVFTTVGHCYLPLALAGFFGLYFRELVHHGDEVLPVVVDLLRLGEFVDAEAVRPELGTLAAVTPLVIAIGAIAGLVMLTRMAGKCGLSWLSLRAHQVIMVVTALLFLRLL